MIAQEKVSKLAPRGTRMGMTQKLLKFRLIGNSEVIETARTPPTPKESPFPLAITMRMRMTVLCATTKNKERKRTHSLLRGAVHLSKTSIVVT